MGSGGNATTRAAVVPTSTPLDDAVLVASLGTGDAGALEALYERYSRAVYSLAVHLLADSGQAEEVLQETFLKLWNQPAAYQPARGRLLAWLLGVAHHHAIDLLRRRQLERRHRADPPPGEDGQAPEGFEQFGLASSEGDPEAGVQVGERQQAVLRALDSLPPEQRVALELAYYRGLTQVEIAETLRQPLGTIKTRMRLALQRLRAAPGLADVWDRP